MNFRSEEAEHLWWDLAEQLLLKDPNSAPNVPGWCDAVVGAWEKRRTPPEAGGADRRLVERVMLLEAALKDAQGELETAREALGAYRLVEGTVTESIGAMKTSLERTAAILSDRLDQALTELDRYHQNPPPAGKPGQ